MPSITFWNRLEPRARSADLAEALAARVRDPAWFLTRQWQLGEMQGEDAGSPAYLRIAADVAPLCGWSAANAPPSTAAPLIADAPMESTVTAEPWSRHDLIVAVELGQQLDRVLVESQATDLRVSFLEAYPIAEHAEQDDAASSRLRAIWRTRAIDGVALYLATQQSPPAAPPGTPPEQPPPPPGVPWSISASRWSQAGQIVEQLVAWVDEVHGAIGDEDPAGWRPDRLDYALQVYAGAPTGDARRLTAAPRNTGDVDWHGFELTDSTALPGTIAAPVISTIQRAVIPGPVKFRGMASERFWDFEDGRVDFGALRPDRRNLATMVLMDFMLVHGNDWFLVPFELPTGTLCSSTLTMVDVFGESTNIPRADAAGGGWSMFSITKSDGAPANFFLLPNATVTLDGPIVEEVRFLRDDTANLVWAIEHAVESTRGVAWPGHERALANALPAEPTTSTAPLRYRLQTSVPDHWFPFQPVRMPESYEIALEQAALLDVTSSGGTTLPEAVGRILRPTSLAGPYRIREEEVPREGRRVARRVRYARGADGRTHVWSTRTRSVGTGEGWSGLRFDLAVPTVPPEEE